MSNATQRVEEIRELIAKQPELDPEFVTRVLKLCRMHENLDETNAVERQRLVQAREAATKFSNRERKEYERLVTRVHNQRVEINRLHRRIDELEASQGPAPKAATQPTSGGGSEPGDGVPGDDPVHYEEVFPTIAARIAGTQARVSESGVPTSEEVL